MGKSVFDVADSITKKLISNDNISIELEFENFRPIDDDYEFLCNEIQHRLRVWYLEESIKYTEPELETMKARMTFTCHAIEVFENANSLCVAICSR